MILGQATAAGCVAGWVVYTHCQYTTWGCASMSITPARNRSHEAGETLCHTVPIGRAHAYPIQHLVGPNAILPLDLEWRDGGYDVLPLRLVLHVLPWVLSCGSLCGYSR